MSDHDVPVITARLNGLAPCPICSGPTLVGEQIAKRWGKWTHETCFQALTPAQRWEITHVVNTEDLDGGYTLLRDKDQLVGSEFIITSHTERFSEQFGSTYSVIRLITKATNSRVVITDGSTGIHFQLSDLPDDAFVYCKNGLVRSDYPASEDYDPEARTGRPAGTTYYLDTSGGRLPAGTL